MMRSSPSFTRSSARSCGSSRKPRGSCRALASVPRASLRGAGRRDGKPRSCTTCPVFGAGVVTAAGGRALKQIWILIVASALLACLGCGSSNSSGTGGTSGTGGAATGGAGGTGAGGSGTAGAPSCGLKGTSCAATSDCCSGLCSGGQCVCTDPGGNCQSSSQCCSGVCASGICAECNPSGGLCQSDANCCSGSCNSGVCGSTNTASIACIVDVSGVQLCTAAKNPPEADKGQLDQACTSNGGTLATSCPTQNLVGCCTMKSSSSNNLAVEACYYDTSTDYQTACANDNGTWSTSP
jgi:hypothetical protein